MKIKVVGTRKLDFTTKENQQINGTQIFALYQDNSPYVIGESVLVKKSNNGSTFKFPFVPSSVLSDIPLGTYEIESDFVTGQISKMVLVK